MCLEALQLCHYLYLDTFHLVSSINTPEKWRGQERTNVKACLTYLRLPPQAKIPQHAPTHDIQSRTAAARANQVCKIKYKLIRGHCQDESERTPEPHVAFTWLFVLSAILCRATATKMTSMRKTTVVTTAARIATPRVTPEHKRERASGR